PFDWFEGDAKGIAQHEIHFESFKLLREQRRRGYNLFYFRRILQRNNKRRHLQPHTPSEKIPANTRNVDPNLRGKGFDSYELILIIVKLQREIDAGGVILVERVENPEYGCRQKAQCHGFPVSA